MLKHIDMLLFPCRCCGKSEIKPELSLLLRSLDEALEKHGGAVRVNSGYRCQTHNAKVGGVPTSRHMTGEAVDLAPVHPQTFSPADLLALINRELGTQGDYKGGLGLYRSFVHMDIGKRSRWNG